MCLVSCQAVSLVTDISFMVMKKIIFTLLVILVAGAGVYWRELIEARPDLYPFGVESVSALWPVTVIGPNVGWLEDTEVRFGLAPWKKSSPQNEFIASLIIQKKGGGTLLREGQNLNGHALQIVAYSKDQKIWSQRVLELSGDDASQASLMVLVGGRRTWFAELHQRMVEKDPTLRFTLQHLPSS